MNLTISQDKRIIQHRATPPTTLLAEVRSLAHERSELIVSICYLAYGHTCRK